jgi:hypothetical protein
MITLQYLITGTGRCGTVFMANFMNTLNLPCGHEAIFSYDGLFAAKQRLKKLKPIICSPTSHLTVASEIIVADSSYMSAPFLNDDILSNTKLIHIIRNPINVVNSFCNYLDYFTSSVPTNVYEEFIFKHLPILKNSHISQFERCALFYVEWNLMIEKNSKNNVLFHKIEDSKQPLLEYFNKKNNSNIFSNTKINTYEKPCKKFTLNQLTGEIKERFVEISYRYGYKILSPDLIKLI